MANEKRLIDANDACKRCMVPNSDACKYCIVGTAPTVDAVEVVRCKDCKQSGMYCFGASHEPTFACLDIEEDGFVRMATATDPEGYCSKGERKYNG